MACVRNASVYSPDSGNVGGGTCAPMEGSPTDTVSELRLGTQDAHRTTAATMAGIHNDPIRRVDLVVTAATVSGSR